MNKGIIRESSLTTEVYNSENYFSITQWSSYLQQINLIRECNFKMPASKKTSIAEIGKGAGIVNQFLKYMDFDVTSFDVNPNLKPDKIIDISNLDMGGGENKKYDIVLCAEVLEHIKFSKFEVCLKNIYSLSKKYVVITLPDAKKGYYCDISIPKIHKYLYIPDFRKHKIYEGHFWEINNSNNTKILNILSIMNKYYSVIKYGKVRYNPYHYYFMLKKK